jgi:hypothetical protein
LVQLRQSYNLEEMNGENYGYRFPLENDGIFVPGVRSDGRRLLNKIFPPLRGDSSSDGKGAYDRVLEMVTKLVRDANKFPPLLRADTVNWAPR